MGRPRRRKDRPRTRGGRKKRDPSDEVKQERVADAVRVALTATGKMGFDAAAHAVTWAEIDEALRSGLVPGVPKGTTLEAFLKKHGRGP